MLLPTHHATLLELLLVTASWAPASGTWSGPCVGPRTFTEARAQWLSEWQHTRPGLAMHNWTTNVPGTIVPPDDVMVEIVVYGIQSIDNVNQVATIDLIHRTSWTDPRLRFRPASEGGCFTNPWSPEGELGYDGTPEGNVWTPGVAVMNDDKPTKPIYSGWWVYPSGSVWWAKKVQLKVKCNFNFANLPYDSQKCPIRLIGWRDVAYDITLKFKGEGGSVAGKSEGMSTEWDITNVTGRLANPEDSGFLWGGEGLQWDIHLKRKPTYFERYNLMPAVMIVFTTYLSFYISRYAVPARVAIVMISLLGLINLSGGVRGLLPRTDRGCWLLSFIEMSQYFVLYAGVEYACANMLTRAEARIKSALQKQDKREKEERGPLKVRRTSTQVLTATEVMLQNDAETDPNETTQEVSVQIQDDNKPRADDQTRDEFGRLGRLMVFLGSETNPVPRDEHFDIFSRYAFVPVYAIVVGVMYTQFDTITD